MIPINYTIAEINADFADHAARFDQDDANHPNHIEGGNC